MTTDVIVSSAPPERAGVASAISETGAELGGALGIAVLGSIVTVVYRGAMATVEPAGLPAAAAEAARDTLGGATAVAEQLSGPIGTALLETAREAFTQGVIVAATISAMVGVGAALATAIILRDVGRKAAE
jgi:DHA2 family multidrug resistance protein-like MFS transporter